jgi:hypothetical protein
MNRRSGALFCIVGGLILGSCSTSTVEPMETTTSISLSHLATCSASDLDATGGWQGATQTMLGGISLTNISKSACTMYGFPKVELFDKQGAIVRERTLHGVSPASSRLTDKARIFVVPPGEPKLAFIPLQFSCDGPIPDVRIVWVVLPDGTSLYAKPGGYPWTVESCVQGVTGISTLLEGPVQSQPT